MYKITVFRPFYINQYKTTFEIMKKTWEEPNSHARSSCLKTFFNPFYMDIKQNHGLAGSVGGGNSLWYHGEINLWSMLRERNSYTEKGQNISVRIAIKYKVFLDWTSHSALNRVDESTLRVYYTLTSVLGNGILRKMLESAVKILNMQAPQWSL